MLGLLGLLGCSSRSSTEEASLLVMVVGWIQRKIVSQECSVGSYWNNPADPADPACFKQWALAAGCRRAAKAW
jgi:hypothetical protein